LDQNVTQKLETHNVDNGVSLGCVTPVQEATTRIGDVDKVRKVT